MIHTSKRSEHSILTPIPQKMPKPVEALSGRMLPPSNVTFGRHKLGYDSISKTAYEIEGDPATVFAGPNREGEREKVLKFVSGSHFVLGDEVLNYSTSKGLADKGYVGGGPSSFDVSMLKTLRSSSITLGNDKPHYQSQIKSDYINNFQGPNKLYRGQDVRSGGAFVFGDDKTTYETEQRQHFIDTANKGGVADGKGAVTSLSGRAIPPSNVYFGSNSTVYKSTSIAHRDHPGKVRRQQSTDVTGMLRDAHVVLGDDVVDYTRKV